MGGRNVGWIIVVAGLVLAGIGVLIALGELSWFGRLPGDVRMQRDGFFLAIPITSMILLSVILTLVFWAIGFFTTPRR